MVGGVVALPERVVAAGAWPGAGDEAYLFKVVVWTSQIGRGARSEMFCGRAGDCAVQAARRADSSSVGLRGRVA
jgi:hypothetical protein